MMHGIFGKQFGRRSLWNMSAWLLSYLIQLTKIYLYRIIILTLFIQHKLTWLIIWGTGWRLISDELLTLGEVLGVGFGFKRVLLYFTDKRIIVHILNSICSPILIVFQFLRLIITVKFFYFFWDCANRWLVLVCHAVLWHLRVIIVLFHL